MSIHAVHIIDNSKPHITEDFYLINDVKSGPFKRYIDGELVCSEMYINGKLDGPSIIYYSGGPNSGKPLQIYNYKNGLRHGSSTIYSHEGVVIESNEYLNGELHGESKTFNGDGVLKSFGIFINGLKEGEHIEYEDNGKISKKYTYVNGKKHGPCSIYMGWDDNYMHRIFVNDEMQKNN
jgi:antitoxin component YwqK of YwqJK toxin-antitoxin module